MSDLPPPLVQVVDVTKTFGEKAALSNFSLQVPTGQICGLLGKNGAGKTTLFRLLMGILKADAGTLQIAGLDAFEDRTASKRLVGFVPDEPVFYSYLSGREVLELSAGMHGLAPDASNQRITTLAQRLELTEALSQFAEDYSRGMKKKLGLLLALLHTPKLLILDEPTNGLDVESTRLFYDLMHEEAQAGTTILFSSHLMDQVSRLCTHATIIHRGRLAATGTLAELRVQAGDRTSLEEIFLHFTADAASAAA